MIKPKHHPVMVTAALAVTITLSACSSNVTSTSGSFDELDEVQLSDVPDPDVVNRHMGDCMTDLGYPTELQADGSLIVDHADEQADVVAQALDDCFETLVEQGIAPHPDAPLSEEVIRDIFDREIGLHDCLVLNDFPSTQAPSWETFLDSIRNGNPEERWDPFSKVREAELGGSSGLMALAASTCELD